MGPYLCYNLLYILHLLVATYITIRLVEGSTELYCADFQISISAMLNKASVLSNSPALYSTITPYLVPSTQLFPFMQVSHLLLEN